jgi:sec-independent protein translocase protein TatB
MFDLGWSEMLIIGVAALIVVGPKDLPRMLRTLGQYAGKARSMAREFQRSLDEAARQADIDELKEVKKDLDDMRDAHYKMQRDMSQSFLDDPKPESKKVPPSERTAEALQAAPEPAPEPASEAAPDSSEDPSTKPRAAPDNVSGA